MYLNESVRAQEVDQSDRFDSLRVQLDTRARTDQPSAKQIRYLQSVSWDLGVPAGSQPWLRSAARLLGRDSRLLPFQLSKREISIVIDAIKKKIAERDAGIVRMSADEHRALEDPWEIR